MPYVSYWTGQQISSSGPIVIQWYLTLDKIGVTILNTFPCKFVAKERQA